MVLNQVHTFLALFSCWELIWKKIGKISFLNYLIVNRSNVYWLFFLKAYQHLMVYLMPIFD